MVEEYRILNAGETIQEGDEVDACANPWRDAPRWEKTRCVGQTAPDPTCVSHRVYRRKIEQRLCTQCGKNKPFEINGKIGNVCAKCILKFIESDEL